MIQYVIAGLAVGAIYAIASSALVITYTSSGILNFAFGSTAYLIARIYYYLHTEQHWAILPSAALTLFGFCPVIGVFLWALLFRHLRLASQFIKIASTIGLSVAIPALCSIIFGNAPIQLVPGLAPQPVRVFHPLGVAISLDTVIVFASTALVLLGGGTLLRFTLVGLKVRATVDSEAMSSLAGVSPVTVSLGVSVVTTFLTGLAGILVGPIIGLTSDNYLMFMTAAFAAVVAARLRSLSVAICVSLLIGVVLGLIHRYLPGNSMITGDLITSLPMIVIVVCLGLFLLLRWPVGGTGAFGKLDLAIRPAAAEAMGNTTGGLAAHVASAGGVRAGRLTRDEWLKIASGFALLALLPVVFHGFWLDLIAAGFAFALVFLPIMLLSGDGGMIWLCQITFAGIGAITVGQLNGYWHWPVLPALLVGGVAAIPLGLLVGLLTIRLGELYVALVTVTVGLLFETIVFTLPRFYNDGLGVTVSRPGFASGTLPFAYLALGLLIVATLLVLNLRRSTTGLALHAVFSSAAASRTLGLSLTSVRLLTASIGAFGSGVGGALLASYAGAALPDSYLTFAGLVWFAVVTTIGLRSIVGAIFAGVSFSLLPGIFAAYVPLSWADVPTAVFGVGAILVARNPDGIVAMHARQLQGVVRQLAKLARRGGDVGDGRASAPTGPHRVAGNEPAAPLRPSSRPLGEPRLAVKGIRVDFGGLRALDDVTVEVRTGGITGLIGPNGAGKSTLLAVMSGLQRPARGSVIFNGRDITHLPPHDRAREGLARTFQHSELFADLTVRDHIVLGDRIHFARRRVWSDVVTGRGMRSNDAAETQRVDQIIELLGLQSVAGRPAIGLPLGVGRLVEVARALATCPSVLLLDEPSAGLDIAETSALAQALIVASEQRDIAMLLVEHDVNLVMSLSSAVYALDFGRLIASGTPDDVRASALVQDAYFGDSELASTGDRA